MKGLPTVAMVVWYSKGVTFQPVLDDLDVEIVGLGIY